MCTFFALSKTKSSIVLPSIKLNFLVLISLLSYLLHCWVSWKKTCSKNYISEVARWLQERVDKHAGKESKSHMLQRTYTSWLYGSFKWQLQNCQKRLYKSEDETEDIRNITDKKLQAIIKQTRKLCSTYAI